MTLAEPARADDPIAWTLIFAAWLVAAGATLGALFFGEIMHLPVCVLCWYQRICMFPLALILPLGLFPFDRKVIRYGLPLAVAGALVALFHQGVVAGWIPERIQPCTQGVPCSLTVASWFGFVTIPLLSLFAFALIVALLLAARTRSSR
ncbi:MAG: disulfide bond formation protein B [Betaproteobacteria bacterium]